MWWTRCQTLQRNQWSLFYNSSCPFKWKNISLNKTNRVKLWRYLDNSDTRQYTNTSITICFQSFKDSSNHRAPEKGMFLCKFPQMFSTTERETFHTHQTQVAMEDLIHFSYGFQWYLLFSLITRLVHTAYTKHAKDFPPLHRKAPDDVILVKCIEAAQSPCLMSKSESVIPRCPL